MQNTWRDTRARAHTRGERAHARAARALHHAAAMQARGPHHINHGHINPHLPTTAFSGYWDDATNRPNLKPPTSPDTVFTNFARQPPEEHLKPAERRTPEPNLPAVIASLAIKYDLSDHEMCKLAAELGGVRTHVDEAFKLLEMNPPVPQSAESPAVPKAPESRGPAPGAGPWPVSSPQPDQKSADDDDPFEVVMEKRHVVVKAMRWLAEALTELSFVLPKPTHIPEALGAVDEALALVRATGDRATEQQLVVFHSDLNDALAEHKRWMEQQMLIRPTRQKLHVAEVAKVEAAIKAARGVLADAIKALVTAEEVQALRRIGIGPSTREPSTEQRPRLRRRVTWSAKVQTDEPATPNNTASNAYSPWGEASPSSCLRSPTVLSDPGPRRQGTFTAPLPGAALPLPEGERPRPPGMLKRQSTLDQLAAMAGSVKNLFWHERDLAKETPTRLTSPPPPPPPPPAQLRQPASAESQKPTMQQLLRQKREAQERALANHIPTGARNTREVPRAKTPVGITTPWTTREEVPRAKKALAWDA